MPLYHSPFVCSPILENPSGNYDSSKMSYFSRFLFKMRCRQTHPISSKIDAGTYFGFYLDSNNTGTKLSTLNASNSDGVDHVLIFKTNKGYTVAFEDIVGGGDRDYEDLVVNVKGGGVTVPEPATIILLATGLLGLAGFRKKKSKSQ